MNTVDLRRPRHFSAACAAVAAFAWLGTQPASAEVANPGLVPAESAYILSVPNAPTFWAAWEGNGLYDAYKKIMAMPEVEAKIANFRKELGIVESSLGFKLDGPTLSQVFGAVDVYMVPAAGEGEPTIAGVFKVTDEEKFTKLIDLAEKAAAQASTSDEESTETEKSDDKTSAISETDYQGIKIKTFKAGEDSSNFVYARTDGLFMVAASEDDVKKIIDRSKAATPAADTVAASEDYKKIDAALAAEKGELYVYGNQELAMKIQETGGEQATWGKSLQGLMDNFAPISYYGASVKFAPKEISSYSYGIIKEGSENSLLVKNPGDQPLKALNYIPETTLMAAATSLFDAKSFYGLATDIADAAEGEDSEGPSLKEKMDSAETILGFSIEGDLVPALGNEAALAVNEVKASGFIPQVDANIMLGVGDQAKMKKVVDSLERLATNALAAKQEDSSTTAGFSTEEVNGQTIKYLEIPGLMGYAPGFVLTEDFLVIGSTKSALTNAVKANGGASLGSSEALKSLGHGISASGNMVQFANMNKILDAAGDIMSNFPATQEATKYIEVLKVMDVSGQVSRVENGAAISHGVLKLK